MARIKFTGISDLVINGPGSAVLSSVTDAELVIEDEIVIYSGSAESGIEVDQVIDLGGRAVIPGFVDSHAHLVFAGDRAAEFDARMSGQPYTAGGIRSTVAATRAASREELRANTARLVDEMTRSGITTFECKTGYGLTVESEIMHLEIAREFTEEVTLLAAHVVPPEYEGRADEYVDLIVDEMLPRAVGLAKWVDAFCEEGAFTPAQTRRIFAAAQPMGFGLRIHANQLTQGEGAAIAAEFGCASADHCTQLSETDIEELAGAGTVVTYLPAAEFSTLSAYPNARRPIDASVNVALATNCNPGSSYTTSMPFCIALSVREMGMTPSESVYAATAGGARALGLERVGRLVSGSPADFIVLDAPSHVHLAYRPGVDLIAQVWKAGELVHERGK